jgi:ABC-type multidrug transport system ATPase subunit
MQLSKVTKRLGSIVALDAVDLTVAPGEFVAITGSNGSGCSTLLRVMATIVQPTSGAITVNGVDAVAGVHRVRQGLSYAGDEVLHAPGMLAAEYVAFVREARPGRSTRPAAPSIEDILCRASIEPDRRVDTLSSGLRQRLSLAAAIATHADALLLDTPLSHADEAMYPRLLDWLRELRDSGTTIVVAPGRDAALRLLADRVVRLEQGSVASNRPTGRRQGAVVELADFVREVR